MKKTILLLTFIAIISACTTDKSKLTCYHISLWEDTPAWEMAKAVKKGDTAKINAILNEGTIDIDYRDPIYGQSLLAWAVCNQKIEMIRFLLQKGANPNLHNTFNGRSPIVLACGDRLADIKILELLLEYGGDPNDYVKKTEYVTYQHWTETPLKEAANIDLKKVKLLIEHGAKVDFTPVPGETPLYRAIGRGYTDIIRYLLMEANADYRKAFIVNIEGDTLDFDYLLEHMIYIKEDKKNEENLIAIREFIKKKKEAETNEDTIN